MSSWRTSYGLFGSSVYRERLRELLFIRGFLWRERISLERIKCAERYLGRYECKEIKVDMNDTHKWPLWCGAYINACYTINMKYTSLCKSYKRISQTPPVCGTDHNHSITMSRFPSSSKEAVIIFRSSKTVSITTQAFPDTEIHAWGYMLHARCRIHHARRPLMQFAMHGAVWFPK